MSRPQEPGEDRLSKQHDKMVGIKRGKRKQVKEGKSEGMKEDCEKGTPGRRKERRKTVKE